MTTLASRAARPSLSRRLLRSPVVDLLLGPHGVDRYLELIDPTLTVAEARAEIVAVRRQTARSITLALRANAAWEGFAAGQFAAVGVEIDGVRHTRTFSPACSEHAGRELELTVTERPGGLVSTHLLRCARPGTILHLGRAQGQFTLPRPRPDRLLLISGGSGITPVLAMARTLLDEDPTDPSHPPQIAFLHYARTRQDWLYHRELQELVGRHPGLRVRYETTAGSRSGRIDAATVRSLLSDADADADADAAGATGAVCGPPALVDGALQAWTQAGGDPDRMLRETFTPPWLALAGEAGEGRLRFLSSDRVVALGEGTLLQQAEAAGLSPRFGCRMGICHTCTCRKAAGSVRNVVTGELSDQANEDIQLCVSVPAGDVALEL